MLNFFLLRTYFTGSVNLVGVIHFEIWFGAFLLVYFFHIWGFIFFFLFEILFRTKELATFEYEMMLNISSMHLWLCFYNGMTLMHPMLTEDEELVTNALETIVNLAPLLDLGIFSSSKPSYIKITLEF